MPETFAPQVVVSLEGDGPEERLDLGDRLIAFVFEDSDKKADKAVLTLDNWDLSFFDSGLIVKGAKLTVSWGYPDRMAPPRTVIIRRIKGFTTLQVEAKAQSTLLNRAQTCRAFENVTRSQVARTLAAENGFQGSFVHVEDTDEVYDVVNQVAETDARLLTRLAAKEGFRFFVDQTGFHWHRRRFGQAPVRVYRYFTDPDEGDVESISIENDLSTKPGRVRVRARDPVRKRTVEVVGSDRTTQRTVLGDVIEVVDPETGQTTIERRNATESVRSSPASRPGRVTREANARFRTSARKTVTLSMRIVGNPEQLAKTVISIEGIRPFLSGKYFVTDVKHILSSGGYRSELKCRRAATGRIAREITRAAQSAGTRNRQPPKEADVLEPIELVDPETGETRLVYKRESL
ncbi:MAG: late control protein D [Proteobacteria bacterium]|nr:late control protein D [Pseudomonadota bacterium]